MHELFKQVKLNYTIQLRGWWVFSNGLTLNRVQGVDPALIATVLSTSIDNRSLSAPSTRMFHRYFAEARGLEPRLAVLETAFLPIERYPYIYTKEA